MLFTVDWAGGGVEIRGPGRERGGGGVLASEPAGGRSQATYICKILQG